MHFSRCLNVIWLGVMKDIRSVKIGLPLWQSKRCYCRTG